MTGKIWCMQWHMYKRDYEISRTHTLIPDAGCRYEVVCLYLETLLRLEVSESETGEGDMRQRYCAYPTKSTILSLL